MASRSAMKTCIVRVAGGRQGGGFIYRMFDPRQVGAKGFSIHVSTGHVELQQHGVTSLLYSRIINAEDVRKPINMNSCRKETCIEGCHGQTPELQQRGTGATASGPD